MKKFLKGFSYAFNGLGYTFSTQLNLKIHCLMTMLVIGLCFYLEINIMEWLWIIAAIGIVFMAELFNTALEVLVDMISPNYNPKAGIIKDISAAIVLIAAFMALLTGILILLPKLI